MHITLWNTNKNTGADVEQREAIPRDTSPGQKIQQRQEAVAEGATGIVKTAPDFTRLFFSPDRTMSYLFR